MTDQTQQGGNSQQASGQSSSDSKGQSQSADSGAQGGASGQQNQNQNSGGEQQKGQQQGQQQQATAADARPDWVPEADWNTETKTYKPEFGQKVKDTFA